MRLQVILCFPSSTSGSITSNAIRTFIDICFTIQQMSGTVQDVCHRKKMKEQCFMVSAREQNF